MIIYRGEIAASLGRAFLSVKLRQRIKSTATRPEILGNNYHYYLANNEPIKKTITKSKALPQDPKSQVTI